MRPSDILKGYKTSQNAQKCTHENFIKVYNPASQFLILLILKKKDTFKKCGVIQVPPNNTFYAFLSKL